MSETLLEKLQLKDEKSLLIQGLPSSIEKQFTKLAFSKNVTPWLRNKKIDFALVFAVNETQLRGIINEVLPALHEDGKLWVAYPKTSSKIATTLNRDCSWTCITHAGYEGVNQVPLDHVWIAMNFRKATRIGIKNNVSTLKRIPAVMPERETNPLENIANELKRSKVAAHFFDRLPSTNKKEYVSWITDAKKEVTRSRRLESAINKLIAGKRTPSEV